MSRLREDHAAGRFLAVNQRENKVMKVFVAFELDEDAEKFGGAATVPLSLHEALCKAIHERNEDAENWLTNNITNIADVAVFV